MILGLGVGIVLAVGFIAPLSNELRFAVFPQDEGLLLVYPSMILHGAIPNHTFESVYGVVNQWIIAAAFRVAGSSVTVERAVGTAYRAIILCSLAFVVWRHRGGFAALSAGAICIVLMAGTLGLAAFAWMCALAFASLAFVLLDLGLRTNEDIERPVLVGMGGAAFGLAIGSRLDMTLAIVFAFAALFAVVRRRLWPMALGFAVGLIPFAVNLEQAGPGNVIRDQVVQPIFVSNPARRLPLSNLSWQELALLLLCVAVALSSVILGIVTIRRERTRGSEVLLLAIGAFGCGILPQAFQRPDPLHVALVGCFILPASMLLPAPRLPLGPSTVGVTVLPLLVGVVIVILAVPYYGQIYWDAARPGSSQAENVVTHDGRSVPVDSVEDRRDLTVLFRELDARARPGQRIFVGPRDLRTADYDDTFLYFLLPELVPGSYYLEMNPGVANAKGSQLALDLRTNDFLILDSRYDTVPDPDAATRFGPNTPNIVVSDDFEPITSEGSWTLYQRRAGKPR